MQTKLNHDGTGKDGSSLSAGTIAVVTTAVKAFERQFGCWDSRRLVDGPFSMETAMPEAPYTHESLVLARC